MKSLLEKIGILFVASLVMISLTSCGNKNDSAQDAEITVYSATEDDSHAISADNEEVTYENISVTKSGNGSGEDGDFYGSNAAIFATNGANLTISNADVTTDGEYANAVFAYGEGTTLTISDSTINTSKRNSGGIMVTGGATLYANNLTVTTQGGSSAAIRSDRGGGTEIVNGGTYTANGSGSPAIYSTADVQVSNATLVSGSAQAVVIEGGNKVTLTDCDVTGNNTAKNSDNSDYYQAVMLYQSMSGDASEGEGSFTMSGGSLTSLNGGMFFVTNATYTINLSDVDLTYADDELLRICAAGWGSDGSNGGQVTFNLDNQTIEGKIIIDNISKLNMYLTKNSNFTGTFENEGEVYVSIEEGSTWTLTDDCEITSLTCPADSINLNGHTLTVNGVIYKEGTASTGSEIEFTVSQSGGMGQPGDMPQGEMGDGQTPPEMQSGDKPGDNGQGQAPGNGENPPEKPDGDNGQGDGQTPPEKPDGDQKQMEAPNTTNA